MISIANQTETFVIWERETGRAIHPAIVWQDRRTSAECEAHVRAGHEPLVRARTGLELDATFPATKIRWVLDHVPGALRSAEAGELAHWKILEKLNEKAGNPAIAEAVKGRVLDDPARQTVPGYEDAVKNYYEMLTTP